jgi:hypothetical protein
MKEIYKAAIVIAALSAADVAINSEREALETQLMNERADRANMTAEDHIHEAEKMWDSETEDEMIASGC